MKKRLISILCVLALCLTLLPATALAAQDPVPYIIRGWDGSMVTEAEAMVSDYTTITDSTTAWNGGWYVAAGEVTISQRVTVTGDVHLLLTDGCTLTVNGGIQVEGDNSLTIYGQSAQADTMGRLTASLTATDDYIEQAAIGGNAGQEGGSITIHGGAVEASVAITNVFPDNATSSKNGNAYGAAIGGGRSGDGGRVTVYGGAVEASVAITSDFQSSGTKNTANGNAYGAAIGGGRSGDGGSVTIYGGAVEASVAITNDFPDNADTSLDGTAYGAAIGGGGGDSDNDADGGDGGIVTVYGGTVEASVTTQDPDGSTRGARKAYGAAIGGGGSDNLNGGGSDNSRSGDGGSITISGGTVEAVSYCGAAIGGGSGLGGRSTSGSDGSDGSGTSDGNGTSGGSGTSDGSGGSDGSDGSGGSGTSGGSGNNYLSGGGDGGFITISGGTVEARSACGAAIGGGSGGMAFINSFSRAIKGGDGGTIIISGGAVTASTIPGLPPGMLGDQEQTSAGAAIGGGSCGGDGGTITISGGTVSAIVSGQSDPDITPDPDDIPPSGAGIGGGFGSSGGGTITISGGTVEARSPSGAGIGNGYGYRSDSDDDSDDDGDGSGEITISGGMVKAASTEGAGIGGGGVNSVATITISGGTVEAVSTLGAGIGGGAGKADAITIPDDDSGSGSSGDSGSSNTIIPIGGDGGIITISGGTVKAASAKGAGIGGGYGYAIVSNDDDDNSSDSGGDSDSTTFLPGIGGDGGTITISGGTVEAVSTEGAGIGGGNGEVAPGGSGTFATGSSGNAVIFATGSTHHIQDDDDTTGWYGVIFLGGEGRIYGSAVTVSQDFTIPAGKQLDIQDGQTLLLASGVTMAIDNEHCLTGSGTLGSGSGRYQILNPLPVFSPATLVYTGRDLSGSVSLAAPAGPIVVMGQAFTVSGSPTYDDWVITTPVGGMLQLGTYPFSAYNTELGYTVNGQVAVVAGSSPSHNNNYSIVLAQSAHGVVTASHSAAISGATITLTATPDEGYELASLTVTDGKGNEIDLTDESGNQYSFTMPDSRVTVEAVFAEIPPEALPFTDVSETAWYADAVRYAYENGLMNGISATLFAPNGTMNRAMLVTILHRQAGEPQVNATLPFTDVAGGTWYSEAVRWAAAEGIVTGITDTTFAPDSPVTREQFATILYRYAQQSGADVSAGEDTNILSYADALEISEYAVPAMQWACGAGVMQGSGAKLNPQDSATRAEAATMLMRFCEGYAI